MYIRFILFILFIILCSSCKREVSNPELLDPIYVDLVSSLREAEGALAAAKSSLEKAQKELLKSEPRTIDRKNAENDVSRHTRAVSHNTQLVEYLSIRVERRKVEGRRAYKVAFMNNQPWPDPSEFEKYKINKRLTGASRNWSSRVPKPEYHKGEIERQVEGNKEQKSESSH